MLFGGRSYRCTHRRATGVRVEGVKLERQSTVKIEPQGVVARFTHRVHHLYCGSGRQRGEPAAYSGGADGSAHPDCLCQT